MCALTAEELLKLKPGDVVWGVLKEGRTSSAKTLVKIEVIRIRISSGIYGSIGIVTGLSIWSTQERYFYKNYWEARKEHYKMWGQQCQS